MRLYIQENKNLIKYNLPIKVDGSILFSFYSVSNGMNNSINIDAVDGKWVLKSNGNINIINSDYTVIDEMILSEYICIPILINGSDEYNYIFCLPSVLENQYSYIVDKQERITIGSSANNNIVYRQNMMLDTHAIIVRDKNNWFISPFTKDDNDKLYVNNNRIMNTTPLFVGDIIFMNGFRIIWMKSSFIIPMDEKVYNVNGFQNTIINNAISNKSYTPSTEIENNVTLYKDDEYFSHTPRIKSILTEKNVKIDPPPGKNITDNDMPFLLSIGSSFTMLGMMSITAINAFSSLSNGTKDYIDLLPQFLMIFFMLFGSLFIPIITRRWQKKLSIRREKQRQKKYMNYLLEKENEIKEIKNEQEHNVIKNNISYQDCIDILRGKTRMLWNHSSNDDDFLEIRLGIGDRPSLINVSAPEEKFTLDDDNLYDAVVKLGKKYNKLNQVPITVKLKEHRVISLIVQDNNYISFINNIVIQLLAMHSPLDLKIVLLTDSINKSSWDYLKYTKHIWSDDFQTRFFAETQDELKTLCQYLDTELSDRMQKRNEKRRENDGIKKEVDEEYELFDSYYLIITDNFKNIRGSKFTEDLLENQFNYGFSMLIIDKNMKNLPNECRKLILLNGEKSAVFDNRITDKDIISFKPDYAENINMREISKIVGNIPVIGHALESQLPNSISFLQMYNVGKIEQLNVRNRWSLSDPMNSLSVPVGVHTNGELFNLDLHEKYDGPHGLIAGSTGSGKSEFIITYILSMALNFDPKEVQFVLIDYKGGGLAGAFENADAGISIPHLAGTITNLDSAEINRTLVSISSELRRRQLLFNKVKDSTGESTMDIYKYQRLFREGLIKEPISHLFIISDEFAELKAQQPEFMQQLVQTARIGRSLGVHLILATQKPSGVVNDQIWSNSRFKVCLKVQTRADSMEMLKRPEAASIKETGRFYLQVGYDEYFDIGQSAWSGEKYVPVERLSKKTDDSICIVGNFGNVIKRNVELLKKDTSAVDYGDQLTNIVKYLSKIAKEDNFVIKKLWLPSLEKEILLSSLIDKYKINNINENNFSIKALIGEYDAPQNQEQGPLILDVLNTGNTLIYGSAGSGKENLITTIIYYLSSNLNVDDINFYIGDFGSETLKILQSIPHVGDVFTIEETTKLENLLKMLYKELEKRKKLYAEYGGSFVDYYSLTGKKDPFIIVALNNYENFVENYSKIYEAFYTVFREGFKYGISFIVSTTQQNALRSRVSQNFVNKICLKMPNDSDYRDILGVPRGMIPANTFGRGIISLDGDRKYEFQSAIVCKRSERTKIIKNLGVELLVKNKKKRARKIPILPEIVYVDDVLFELKDLTCVPIGIEKNSLEVYVYDFLEFKTNLIAAKSIKNHIYFIYALIKQMLMLKHVKIHVIDVLSIYRNDFKNIDLYEDNVEAGFINAYNNVKNDNLLEEKHVYFVLGISEFSKKISVKYKKQFEALFYNVTKCKNNTFLFFDDSAAYKTIQTEDWFRDNINNTYGIWLGEDIGIQVALGVMSLSLEDREKIFACIGYPIYQGRHMIIKYVVDGVDKKDE